MRNYLVQSFLFITFTLMAFTSKATTENNLYLYLKNAELQCETDEQRENIKTAFNDALTLSAEELKAKKYKDYTGKANQWDLPTLIEKHYLPTKARKAASGNFYTEIKYKKVQKQLKKIIKKEL